MSIEAKILNRLKAAQQDFAVDALRQPQTRDAFEYGYRVGIFTGYEAAIAVLLKIIDEEKFGDKDL